MTFSSYAFIFCFLPLFLVAWHFAALEKSGRGPAFLLLASSLLFYAFWGMQQLLIPLIIILMNVAFAPLIRPEPEDSAAEAGRRKKIFILALSLNLLPLLWFKYSFFLNENLALLFQTSWSFEPPIPPAGISFYTFIQLAWLCGIRRGLFSPPGLFQHALFSTCFPYLISGPIVRYEQLGWQLERLSPLSAQGLAHGFALFSIGLAKKAILADGTGFYADAVFGAAEKGWPLCPADAWLGAFSYSFQLYFDFSGYTDMALGIGLMIGLRLPENFNSPYKATGIVDFWRRWHITLSSWLRDFLYIPLGGNRHGKARQYLNLFLTMLIGGAWHGAGWTYILWGALHGLMLSVNHFFRAAIRGSRLESFCGLPPMRLFFIAFTFLLITLCWVPFRAFSLDGALAIFEAMSGAAAGEPAFGPASAHFAGWQPAALLCACAAVCWFFPTSHAILHGQGRWLAWRPSRAWAFVLALLAFVSLALVSRGSTFLYFQF